jgi:hypothetical protein
MTDRRPTIGIDRKIRLAWLDTAAGLVAKGSTPAEIRSQLDRELAQEIAGEGAHGARGKTLTVLLHIWVLVPPPLRGFRDHAIALLQQAPPKDRICLHWGMALATYPFFRDHATNIGRLLALQGNVTLGQLTRRMAESWGERTTLVRAVQRVARSMVEWGILAESMERGVYEPVSRQPVPGVEMAAWMLESLLRAFQLQTSSFGQLVSSPALFPFSIPVSPGNIRDHPRLELGRQGLDEDILILRPDPEPKTATTRLSPRTSKPGADRN